LALSSIEDEEAWRRAMVLQVTCSPLELLDPELPADDLLYRLFHEEGVRAFEPRPLDGRCRCSRQRLEALLVALPAEDVATMKVDGEVQATCEFCNTIYRFDEAALAVLLSGTGTGVS
jgi:molecular chaperone Hsp33